VILSLAIKDENAMYQFHEGETHAIVIIPYVSIETNKNAYKQSKLIVAKPKNLNIATTTITLFQHLHI